MLWTMTCVPGVREVLPKIWVDFEMIRCGGGGRWMVVGLSCWAWVILRWAMNRASGLWLF